MLGITIQQFDKMTDDVLDEKHTFEDFGLKWLEPYKVDFPEVDEYVVEVPGAYIPIDLTEEITGHIPYKPRPVEFNFEVPDQNYYDYETIKMQIGEYIHGRKLRLYLDTDPDYFYLVRIKVNFEKSEKTTSTLTLTGKADPYKYNRNSSLDDWLWDTFDFETGIIGQSSDIEVNGEFIETLPGTQIPVAPTFICDSAMSVEYEGVVHDLHEGENYNPYIVLKNQDNVLKFIGNGIVDIKYRGGVL